MEPKTLRFCSSPGQGMMCAEAGCARDILCICVHIRIGLERTVNSFTLCIREIESTCAVLEYGQHLVYQEQPVLRH